MLFQDIYKILTDAECMGYMLEGFRNTLLLTLVAAALVTGGDAAVVVAAGFLGQGLQEGLLGLAAGDLSEVGDGLETPTSARGLEVLDCH